MVNKIGIIGGGAWGLSLGLHYHRLGWLSGLYSRYDATISAIKENHTTPKLVDTVFPTDFPISTDHQQALQAENILLAGTVAALPEHCAQIAQDYTAQNILLCCKGQNPENYRFPHEIAADYLPEEHIYLLSGPSFAADIAASRAVAVSLAGKDLLATTELAQNLTAPLLRLYASDDRTGVAIGGAYKNVLAIAAGIARGLEIGASAEAALVTRGLAELQSLCAALGGMRQTMFGLAGLGDLILSCNSTQSRNFRYGLALGQGQSPETARESIAAAIEGHYTTQSLPHMINTHQLELPICTAVYDVLFAGIPPQTALETLLNRPGGKTE